MSRKMYRWCLAGIGLLCAGAVGMLVWDCAIGGPQLVVVVCTFGTLANAVMSVAMLKNARSY